MWTLAPGRIEIPAASPCPSDAKLDPRICPIWPPRGHLFHVQPAASLVDVRPRGAPNGGSNMARKTYNSVEHDQSAGTELDAEIPRIRAPRRRDQPRTPPGQRKRDGGRQHQLGAAAGNYDLGAGDRQAHHGAADLERHAAQ